MLIDIASVHIVANVDGTGGAACKSLRNKLPPRATAGIECIGDAEVDVGDYYLFPDTDAALATHTANLADHGVARGSGDCSAGTAGDGAWWIPDGLTAEQSPWRIACFDREDESGLSLVCHDGTPITPSPVLYVSLLSFLDIAATYSYALGSRSAGYPPHICDVFNDGESALVNTYFGVGQCSPTPRSDLPRNAFAGVQCFVGDSLVNRVGLYLMGGNNEARNLYVDRLAQYDVALDSGACGAGSPGDSAWVEWAPFLRSGCFLNESNHANVRLTCVPDFGDADVDPPPGMYVGVLGASADVAGLYNWATGGADWLKHVHDYQSGPDDTGFGPQPAICFKDWFDQ